MNKTLIVNSSLDPGGSNIRERLTEGFPFKEIETIFDSLPVYEYSNILLATTKREIIRVGKELDENFADQVESYVFISKHRAESGIPSLTSHFTGNFGSAEFGGNPREIARYLPSFLKKYMLSLFTFKAEIPSKYNLTLEATHHGPTELTKPSMFVEIGSSPEEWVDVKGGLCVAEALVQALSNEKKYAKTAVCFGGTHYPEKFNKLILDTEISIGVIAPKYVLDLIDEDIVRQSIEKSDERITMAALDMKGLGKNKGRILEIVEKLDLELLKV